MQKFSFLNDAKMKIKIESYSGRIETLTVSCMETAYILWIFLILGILIGIF